MKNTEAAGAAEATLNNNDNEVDFEIKKYIQDDLVTAIREAVADQVSEQLSPLQAQVDALTISLENSARDFEMVVPKRRSAFAIFLLGGLAGAAGTIALSYAVVRNTDKAKVLEEVSEA